MAGGYHCHDHAHSGTSSGNPPLHHHNHALTCCMGCLGCAIAPEPGSNVALVGFSSLIRYGEWPCALAGRVPYTEPDPPDPAHEVDFVAESPSSGGNFSLSG
jgi:hypothetical protein